LNNNILNIELIGRVNQSELHNYFNIAHIGISLIPIKPWFENQPPTKTFEYLVSGLPVLATATKENKKVITKENGILINDDIDSIKDGLRKIMKGFLDQSFNSQKIMETNKMYSWEYIVKNSFEKVLNS
jgi:glycosyltransferase involved in cell wall biosynthesis